MIKVNLKLLPVKFHYFLFNGALSGAIPFLPVFASELGLSATSIGLIYSILPFLAVIAKPLFGYIADKLQVLKAILIVFIIVITLSTLGMNFIQNHSSPLPSFNGTNDIHCINVETIDRFANETNAICLKDISIEEPLQCDLNCTECYFKHTKGNFSGKYVTDWSSCELNSSPYVQVDESSSKKNASLLLQQWEFSVTNISLNQSNLNIHCLSNHYFACSRSCDPKPNHCFAVESKSDFTSSRFWIFFLLIIALWVSTGISVSLADAACFNILANQAHLYGRQRLWGTIGWGLFVAISGYLNAIATPVNSKANYSPGFYVLIVLMLFDLISVYFIKMENVKVSQAPLKDVKSLLVVPKIIEFIVAVFMVGSFTGLLWHYLFLYLLSLQATHVIFGLLSAVQCFLGELPFFFFAGWVIRKIGHAQTLTVTFCAFGFRFILYSYLTNPWWVLPIELLQGPTFGAFYSAMTSYAYVVAPPGTEATMQGLVGAAFEGLGVAVGSLLGGICFDVYSGKTMFFWAGLIAFASSILHFGISKIIIPRDKKIDEVNRQEVEAERPEESSSFL